MVHSPVPLWDLPLALQDFQRAPFEPLDAVEFRFLAAIVVFLVVIPLGGGLGSLGPCFPPLLFSIFT